MKYLCLIWSTLNNCLFPKKCAGCKYKGKYLCDNCLDKIPRGSNYNDQVLATVPYSNDVVRKLIWLLKFKGVKEIAEIFADWVYESLLDSLSEAAMYREQKGKIVIIPIPLSAGRKLSRGFNQSEEIAQKLAILDPHLFRLEINNLYKSKDTPSQVSRKSRTERLSNLNGVFNLKNKKSLRGKTIIILDDVVTTGATLAAAEKIILRAKPRIIIKVAVAF